LQVDEAGVKVIGEALACPTTKTKAREHSHIFEGREKIRAVFCRRRRHQPRRPPLAKIKPSSPAPTMGPGTAAEGPVISTSSKKAAKSPWNASVVCRAAEPCYLDTIIRS
jgi:hypothetical protein